MCMKHGRYRAMSAIPISYFKKKRIIYNTHEIWMSTTQQKNIHTHLKSTFSWRFNVFVSVDDCQNDTLLKNHRFMSIHWLFTNNINSILSFCLFPLYITKKNAWINWIPVGHNYVVLFWFRGIFVFRWECSNFK